MPEASPEQLRPIRKQAAIQKQMDAYKEQMESSDEGTATAAANKLNTLVVATTTLDLGRCAQDVAANNPRTEVFEMPDRYVDVA